MEERKFLKEVGECRISNIDALKVKYKTNKILKLDANENPSAINFNTRAWNKILKKINYYPDDACMKLRKELSTMLKLDKNNFLFGNGSSEIISLIIKTFVEVGDKVITPVPTFLPYITESKIAGAIVEEVTLTPDFKIDLNTILNKIDNKTKLIFIVNPHNPTGTLLEKDELRDFCAKVPQNILIVLDEAYIEYVNDSKKVDIKEFINQFKNLCVIRTFSKAYGLAGARIGYLIANPKLVTTVEKAKLPVNLSYISQMLAVEVLKNKQYLRNTIKKNEFTKKYLYRNLSKLGIEFIPTYTNFVMIKEKESNEMYENLVDNGIVVNQNFKYMENFLRVTIGNMKDMKKMIKCLNMRSKGE